MLCVRLRDPACPGDGRAQPVETSERRACPEGLSLAVSSPKVDRGIQPFAIDRGEDSPSGLCCELTEQGDRRLVHLVNYRDDGPVGPVSVEVRLPQGRKTVSVMLAGPGHKQDISLPCQEKDGAVSFTVPDVKVYEIAILTMR